MGDRKRKLTRRIQTLEEWKNGRMEYWSIDATLLKNGILEEWNIGLRY